MIFTVCMILSMSPSNWMYYGEEGIPSLWWTVWIHVILGVMRFVWCTYYDFCRWMETWNDSRLVAHMFLLQGVRHLIQLLAMIWMRFLVLYSDYLLLLRRSIFKLSSILQFILGQYTHVLTLRIHFSISWYDTCTLFRISFIFLRIGIVSLYSQTSLVPTSLLLKIHLLKD